MPDISSSRYNASSEHLLSSQNFVEPELATPWMVDRKHMTVSEQFIWPEHQRPTVEHDDYRDLEIPVIDLAPILEDDKTAKEAVVSQVREACLNWGFFQIVNHEIPEEVICRIQKQAKQFFSLPFSDKMKVAKEPGRYTGYGHATVKKDDVRPWSEGFYLANDESLIEFSSRLWPQGNNNDFVESYRDYNEKVQQLSERLMHIIVEGLEVDPAHFERYTLNTGGLLRWNYYPACPEPSKTLGLDAHTDFNLLTVLHQGVIGGLQVEKDGKWIAVRPRPGALAINVGDTLQVLTNSRYKSVPHRAVVNAISPRTSLAYFYVPLRSVEIVPSPDLVDEKHPSLYKPFTFETYTKVKQTQFLNTLEHFTRTV